MIFAGVRPTLTFLQPLAPELCGDRPKILFMMWPWFYK
jgi:hypothetical protein